MEESFTLLDVVALLEDMPDEDLRHGHVGTVVEDLAPGVYLVEFADRQGRTYAIATLRTEQLMLLRTVPMVPTQAA